MTFDTFISTWTGKHVDFDGVYPDQCMDLMHQYVYDVLGITDKSVLAHPSAYQVYTAFSETSLFDKIANTPTGVPQKGDIVLFGQAVGTNGHVCIFITGDANSFTSFDANWPSGSLPHQQKHDYNGVLGWLHPKAQDIQALYDQARKDRDHNWDLYQAALADNTKLQDQLKGANEKGQRAQDALTQIIALANQAKA